MRKLLLVLLLLFLLLPSPLTAQDEVGPPQVGFFPDSPEYAKHGPHWVGTRDFVIGAETDRPLEVTLWYPATNLDQVPEAVNYSYDPLLYRPVSVPGHAIAEASPAFADGPYPLVIASHGHDANRFFATYLTEHLASYGFVVIAANHTGNATGDTMYPQPDHVDGIVTAMVNRPRDIQRTIDFATDLTAEGGLLPGLIDLEHTAVLGHSYGGYTTLAAAGARVNFGPIRAAWCDAVANDPVATADWAYFFVCSSIVGHEEQMIEMLGADIKPGEQWPALDVAGIDAIVPLAAFGVIFGEEAFDSVTVPALVIVGSGDGLYDNNMWVYQSLPATDKALVVFENAGHDVLSEGCDDLMKRLNSSGCFSEQVWDPNRVHDRINHFTTAFLLDVLKGDKDAHAALLAENVSFPGITYETTMK